MPSSSLSDDDEQKTLGRLVDKRDRHGITESKGVENEYGSHNLPPSNVKVASRLYRFKEPILCLPLYLSSPLSLSESLSPFPSPHPSS